MLTTFHRTLRILEGRNDQDNRGPNAHLIEGLRLMNMRKMDAEFIVAILTFVDQEKDRDKALDKVKGLIVDECQHPEGLYVPHHRRKKTKRN